MLIPLVVLVLLVLIVLTAVFRWERYRGGPRGDGGAPPPPASRPTSEAFIDPETGRRMRVWYDSRTGERTYRQE
jgi:hypothetical protein